jgi:Flp pilus assembly protein TadG
VGTDRGSSTVEIAVLLPLMMLLLMLVVQAGIYFDTRAVAVAAARKAATTARLDGGSASDGQAIATRFLDENAAALSARRITVTRRGGTASATVSGRVASVLFGVPFNVSVTVDAPVEQVTP